MDSIFGRQGRAYERKSRPDGLRTSFARRWARLSLRHKGVVVVAIPLAALFVSALLAGSANRQEASAVAWTDHTHRVRTDIGTLYTLVAEANNGVRGFLLSGRPSFLTPYQEAVDTLPGGAERPFRARAGQRASGQPG